jgi:hypothetical protein
MLACDPSWTAHHVAWIVIGMVPGWFDDEKARAEAYGLRVQAAAPA